MDIEKLHFNTLVLIATHLDRKELFTISLASKKLLKVAYAAFKQKLIKDYRYHLDSKEACNHIAKFKYSLIENFLSIKDLKQVEGKIISDTGVVKEETNSVRKASNILLKGLSLPQINWNQGVYKSIISFLHSSLENLITLQVVQDFQEAKLSRRQMDNLCALAHQLSKFIPLEITTNELLKKAEMHVGFSDITKLIMPYTNITTNCSLRMKYLQETITKQTLLYVTIEKETYPYQFIRHQNTVCVYKGDIPVANKKHEALADKVVSIFNQTLLLSQKDIKILIASKSGYSRLTEFSNEVTIEIPPGLHLFN